MTVGYNEQVVVYAPRSGTFTLTDSNGTTVGTVQVKAGSTAVVPIAVAPGTVITASGGAAWTVLVRDGAFITALSPTRTTIDAQDVIVVQKRYVPSP